MQSNSVLQCVCTKVCSSCQVFKEFSEFYKSKTGRFSLTAECKVCFKYRQKLIQSKQEHIDKKRESRRQRRHEDVEYRSHINSVKSKWAGNNKHISRASSALYRAKKRQATPSWFDKEKVDLIYKKAESLGFAVDHVVPIQSSIVCGLHTWENLQLLDPLLNSYKNNNFWPDMPELPCNITLPEHIKEIM